MGSGPRFSISWMEEQWCIGIAFVPGMPHRLSFYINLIKLQIYIGFGKGYDE